MTHAVHFLYTSCSDMSEIRLSPKQVVEKANSITKALTLRHAPDDQIIFAQREPVSIQRE